MRIGIQIFRTRDDPPDELISQTVFAPIKESDIWMDRTDFIRQHVEPLIAQLLYEIREKTQRVKQETT